MELDLPALQLYFNVVMIASVSSLAGLCYLLRRANQQLTFELDRLQQLELKEPSPNPPPAFQQLPENQAPAEAPPMQRDIREFVAHRSQKWAVASAGAGR